MNQFANFAVGDIIGLGTAGPTQLFRILSKGARAVVVLREDGSNTKVVLHAHVSYAPYLA